MTSRDSIEITAATIDEAINEALRELGAAEGDVVIEVLSTPRWGLLGLGSRQARVRVSRRKSEGAFSEAQSPPAAPAQRSRSDSPQSQPAPSRPPALDDGSVAGPVESDDESDADLQRMPADLEEQEREAVEALSRILELMGEKAEVKLASSDAEAIELEIKGDGSGILIGRHGQTLDALEYLLNRLVGRKIRDAVSVIVDTETYRARRRHQLERMALSMGERVKRERLKMVMEPMPPRDRRIVHLALRDDPLLYTRSTGDGYMRTVEIVPADGGSRPERPRSRPRERELEAPVGQQGGFKRGQKRIV